MGEHERQRTEGGHLRRTSRWATLALGLSAAAGIGCLDVPLYEGLLCSADDPCPNGLICDPSGRCRTSLQNLDAAIAEVGSPRDAAEPRDTGPGMDVGADAGVPPDLGPMPDGGGVVAARCNDAIEFPSDGWQARHFELQGNFQFGACLGVEDLGGNNLARNYGNTGPVSGVVDNFATRYTATRTLSQGVQTITVTHQDGLRVFVDGRRVYEEWANGRVQNAVALSPYLTAGDHDFIVEHFNETGPAELNVRIEAGCPELESPRNGWQLGFYGLNLQGQVDRNNCFGIENVQGADLDLDYDTGAPAPVLAAQITNDFAVVAKTERTFEGATLFTASFDDSLEVRVANQSVFNEDVPATSRRFGIYTTQSREVEAIMIDRSGAARLALSWQQACRIPVPIRTDVWQVRYYRVAEDRSTNPATYNLDRSDCLGVETLTSIQLDPAFMGNAPNPVAMLNIEDLFGAEYRGIRSFGMGRQVSVLHDDGMRVFSDNQNVYDSWTAPQVIQGSFMMQGTHELRVEYFENRGGAQLRMTW